MRIRKMKRKKRIIGSVTLILLAGVTWTLFIQWLIHTAEHSYSSETRDVGIVLGAALWNDEPSPALRERLDLAVEQYRTGKFRNLIVTGGLDNNGATVTEAEGMAAYLIRKGIPESGIILEPEARSTYQNLKFSQTVMEKNGWKTAYILTHTYHGARALDIARTLDYEAPAVMLTDSQVMWMPWHKARETLAFTKWKLEKWFNLAE